MTVVLIFMVVVPVVYMLLPKSLKKVADDMCIKMVLSHEEVETRQLAIEKRAAKTASMHLKLQEMGKQTVTSYKPKDIPHYQREYGLESNVWTEKKYQKRLAAME